MSSDHSIAAPLLDGRVIDGDTIEATLGLKLRVRLAGIDSPEMGKPVQRTAAEVAMRAVEGWLADQQEAGRTILLRAVQLGMYGRVLGDLYVPETGESLGEALLAAGVAVESPAGRRHHWTDQELARIEAAGDGPE